MPAAFGALTFSQLIGQALFRFAISAALNALKKRLLKGDEPGRRVGTASTPARQVALTRAAEAPAEVVVGRARKSGLVCFYGEQTESVAEDPDTGVPSESSRPSTAWLALVLAQGPCEAVEHVWVDELEFRVTATGGDGALALSPFADDQGTPLDTYVRRPGLMPRARRMVRGDERGRVPLTVYAHLEADGAASSPLRRAGVGWSSADRLHGKSWLAVRLYQPLYSARDPGRPEAGRLWASIPNVSVLLKGAKITWPAQGEPTWTDNAAAVRYWYMTHVLGIPPAAFDLPSVQAAVNACEVSETVDVPSRYRDRGYQPAYRRYSANGIIRSGESTETYLDELDYAWQGFVVERAGLLHFLPGLDRAPVADLDVDADDSPALEPCEVHPVPALSDRVNVISTSIGQSRYHGWQPLTLPLVRDEAAIARDGGELAEDAGTRAFVVDPVVASVLAHIALRRAVAAATYSYTLAPGADARWLALAPGDVVRVSDAENGLALARMEVQSVVVDADWRVELTLSPAPPGLYDKTFDLPALEDRTPSLVDESDRIPDPPEGLTLTGVEVSTAAGDAVDLTMAVPARAYQLWRYVVRRASDGGLIGEMDSTEPQWTLRITQAELLRVRVYAVSPANAISEPVERYWFPSFGAPHAPFEASVIPLAAGSCLCQVTPGLDGPIPQAYEMRYIRQAQTEGLGRRLLLADPAPGDDRMPGREYFADAPVLAVLAGEATRIQASKTVRVRRTGWYKVFVRAFTYTQGSPVIEVTTVFLVGDVVGTVVADGWPAWEGIRNHCRPWYWDDAEPGVLVSDRDHPRSLTRDEWNGVEGWPFGDTENDPTAGVLAYDSGVLAGPDDVSATDPVYLGAGVPRNIAPWAAAPAEWVAGRTYAVGARVQRTTGDVNTWHECTTANSDTTFDPGNWKAIESGAYAVGALVYRAIGGVAVVHRCEVANTDTAFTAAHWSAWWQWGGAVPAWVADHAFAAGERVHRTVGAVTTWYQAKVASNRSAFTVADWDAYPAWAPAPALWVSGGDYLVGDEVRRDDGGVEKWYACSVANSDTTFDAAKWTQAASRAYAVGSRIALPGLAGTVRLYVAIVESAEVEIDLSHWAQVYQPYAVGQRAARVIGAVTALWVATDANADAGFVERHWRFVQEAGPQETLGEHRLGAGSVLRLDPALDLPSLRIRVEGTSDTDGVGYSLRHSTTAPAANGSDLDTLGTQAASIAQTGAGTEDDPYRFAADVTLEGDDAPGDGAYLWLVPDAAAMLSDVRCRLDGRWTRALQFDAHESSYYQTFTQAPGGRYRARVSSFLDLFNVPGAVATADIAITFHYKDFGEAGDEDTFSSVDVSGGEEVDLGADTFFTRYYWRLWLRSLEGYAVRRWSGATTLIVDPPQPITQAPVLSHELPDATRPNFNRFSWSSVEHATAYTIEAKITEAEGWFELGVAAIASFLYTWPGATELTGRMRVRGENRNIDGTVAFKGPYSNELLVTLLPAGAVVYPSVFGGGAQYGIIGRGMT